MTLITCKNGHRYDPSLTSECPECAMLKSHTVALDPSEVGDDGSYRFHTVDVQTNPLSKTVPLSRQESETLEKRVNKIIPVKSGDKSNRSSADGPTMAVNPSGEYIARSAQPITGWLVCIEGPEKGKDYRLHDENNFIGRSSQMDVCISGDRTVSEDRHAVITYDSQERKFFFALSGGSSIVRLNGKAVLMTQEIKYGDRLQIGQGTFLFVPLCGEQFQWEN